METGGIPQVWVPSGSSQPAREAPRVAEPERGFAEVLQSLGERIDQGERLVARVERHGAPIDASQLIALQLGIYRYTESLELASKLVEKTTTALKTTLQGQ